jgi:hypothetical protein
MARSHDKSDHPHRDFSRILLPDPVRSEGLKSLAQVLSTLRSRGKQFPFPQLSKELIDLVPSAIISLVQSLKNPIAASVLVAAQNGTVKLYVADPSNSCYYQIDRAALVTEISGFLMEETIIHGHLTVAPSLMRHGSIEVRAEGQPIFVVVKEVEAALKQRPTSESQLIAIIRQKIDEALERRETPTTREMIKRIQEDERVWGFVQTHSSVISRI